MASVYSQDNEVLQELWGKFNTESSEHMAKEKVIEWIKQALQKTNTLQNFQESLTNLDRLVSEYMSEVHGVNEQNVQNLKLSYAESVDFLKWLTNTQQQQVQNVGKQDEQQQYGQQDEHFEEPMQVSRNFKKQKIQNNDSKHSFHQQGNIIEPVNDSLKGSRSNNLQGLNLENKSRRVEQNQTEHKKVKTEVDQHELNHAEVNRSDEKQEEDINQNLTNGPNQFNLEYLSKRYKQYLRIIFQHYCKISYATGQDPTFQQIMHKTTIMTINKFMMFAKDFQIGKISPLVTRAFLIQIFKKNSQCYKEMSYEQFISVVKKLSNVAYNEMQKDQKQEKDGDELLNEDMVKLLNFLQISTAKMFKEKLRRLNIQYRSGPKTNAELKIVPQGYRFKFTSNNGKSQEQIKQEVSQRKMHRSERRLLLQQKINQSQNQVNLSLNKKSAQNRRNLMNISEEDRVVSKKQGVQSTQILNKILAPPIPPARKITVPSRPNIPNPVNSTKISYSNANSTAQYPSSNAISTHTPIATSVHQNAGNIFKKDLGYAELHKLKQNQGYSKKKVSTNNSRSKDGKGTFKLNSIVEQARLQINNQVLNQGHSQNLSESIATNSRQQAQRLKAYDINKINSKMQLINDKLKRDRQIQQELTHLLDMSNDEEDEYLKQHLQRQKKNQVVGRRLSNRISELEGKF